MRFSKFPKTLQTLKKYLCPLRLSREFYWSGERSHCNSVQFVSQNYRDFSCIFSCTFIVTLSVTKYYCSVVFDYSIIVLFRLFVCLFVCVQWIHVRARGSHNNSSCMRWKPHGDVSSQKDGEIQVRLVYCVLP